MVVNATPFHCTAAPEAKPAPLTVSVKAVPPADAEFGLRDVITCPAAIVKVASAEVTPFSPTATFAAPPAVIKLAGTCADNCVALTKFVVSAVPFHCTTALAAKLLPLTVRVKPAAPAVALEGLSEVIAGGGLMVTVA